MGEFLINVRFQFIEKFQIWGSGLSISSISRLTLSPQGGELFPMVILITVTLVPVLSLEAGLEDLLIPLSIGVEIGIDPSTPVLLICRRVLLVHVLPKGTSTKIYITAGINSV